MLLLLLLVAVAGYLAFPKQWQLNKEFFGRPLRFTLNKPAIDFYFFNWHIYRDDQLKMGLDIQGGMQVTLQAEMPEGLSAEDQQSALAASQEVIARRVDLYGINEAGIRTAKVNEQYRIIVELPGVTDTQQALALLGTTAQLDFRLEKELSDEELAAASSSALTYSDFFIPTGLTGAQLKRAQLQFDPQTGQPVVGLEFNAEGQALFADLTSNNIGKTLAIFLDDRPVALPSISTAILDGRAVMTGGFSVEEAKNMAIQLNAGALPVNISILEQRNIGASLGEESIQASVRAGVIGLALVILFMCLYYGWLGVVASLSLLIYAVLTVALYKVLGVVLTLPGIAGLLLTIGMAVDANILIFERLKEELRAGHSYPQALELAFGRAWDSIKDANLTSIITAIILINPLNFSFLNTSGLVKGFGLTFLIGTVLSLFTGVTISRLLLRAILPMVKSKEFVRGAA